MISYLSLRTTVLVVSILISGILIPYTVFASPIFENDSFKVGPDFRFEPEQTWAKPTSSGVSDGKGAISSVDVVVYEGETLQEVYVLFLEYSIEPNANSIEPDLAVGVSVTPDGPLWVSGEIAVEMSNGNALEVRNRVTLCRCGASTRMPLCDGSHKDIGFSAPQS